MDGGINETLKGYVKDAVLGSLELSGVTHIAQGRHQEWLDEWPAEVYTCILGFYSEEMSGSLLLCCEKDFLKQTIPGGGTSDEEFADWLGELGNIVVGRVKSSMLFHKITLKMNPPSVSSAPHTILDSYAERNPSGPFWFEVDGQRICAQFGCATSGIDFGAKLDHGLLIQAGGAILDMNPVNKKKQQQADGSADSRGEGGIFSRLLTVKATSSGLEVGFESGAKVTINMTDLAGKACRTLDLGGQKLDIEPDRNGIHLKCQGMVFYLPHRQAA